MREDETFGMLFPSHQVGWGADSIIRSSSLPTAGQELLHNGEEPVIAGPVAQPEEQRAGARSRRRRDLGSRLQAQRQAQRVARLEADENEDEAVIPGEWGHSL